MGYAFCMGACIGCGRLFTFNPVRVPSTTAVTGTREPICEHCIAIVNEKRKAQGLEPWPVAPDAYEACEESEL